jgi:putative transposase
MSLVTALNASGVPVTASCAALAVPRSSYYHAQQERATVTTVRRQARSPRALSEAERQQVRDILNSERFVDKAPRDVYATLLDEGTYLCSVRTMYRILDEHGEVRERRDQLRHPHYAKPQLLATAPNQVWSWDITKLRSPFQWTYYYLYVMLDIFSRYVVGWMIAERETAGLARQLLQASCRQHGIPKAQLTLHADRGSPMVAKSMAQLLVDLEVTRSHGRPHTPNDNPFSEAHFKTLKYRPDFPDAFGSIQDARGWARPFFHWYNQEHHHSSLALLTPADVHFGRSATILDQRHAVKLAAYARQPERFVNGPPPRAVLPAAVWINPPPREDETSS